MPESPQSGTVQGVQDANVATTPSTPQEATKDQPTTTQQSETRSVADFLDIPKEVQDQLKPRTVQPMEGDIPATHRELAAEAEAPPAEGPAPPEEMPEAEPEPEPEPEEERPAAEGDQPQRIDKRQKRINRLTRQRNDALDEVDQLKSELARYKGDGREKAEEPSAAIPSASPWLQYISDERQLRSEVAKAESLIDWCDANTEGAGLADESIAPEYKKGYEKGELTHEEAIQRTVAKWRRDADKIVRGAPMRIEEIRAYNKVQTDSDQLSKQAWPEMFDKGTEEYQIAQGLLRQFPFIKHLPQANYAVGLLIEGAKALQWRIDRAQGKNGQHRDISERAFEPRTPLAPHTANPPSREVTPSSTNQKRLNQAMSNLVKDVDGSSASLAAAFAALESANRTRPSSRSAVAS